MISIQKAECLSEGLRLDEIESILEWVDLEAIKKHVQFFEGLGSRFTGYPGFYQAAEYIYEKFKEYGLKDVQYDYYDVPIPRDYGSNITVLSSMGQVKIIQSYPLLPNSIQTCPTPPEGLEGRLIYAGYGSYSEFNGKPVEGSIVLMEFNSYDSWLNAAELGAKAVIFIEPPETNTKQADQKYLKEVPLNFPRVYIKREDGEYLKGLLSQGEVFVNLRSFMRYERSTVCNVIGFLEGSSMPDSVVLLSAYFDSTSVVPSIAPGANEATGIAALLEAARYFAAHPTPRTLMFVAFSGHGQALAGARWFVKHLAYDKKWPQYGISPEAGDSHLDAAWQIDFSTANDEVCFFPTGSFYQQGTYTMERGRYDKFFDALRPKLAEAWKRKYGRTWRYEGSFTITVTPPRPESYAFDAEAIAKIFIMTRPVVYLTTSHVFWWHYMNPTDTLERILPNFDKLKPQVEAFLVSIADFTRYYDRIPAAEVKTNEWTWFFGLWIGKVVEFDERLGWYKPVPYAMVQLRPVEWWNWWRPWINEIADENGTFLAVGLTTWTQASGCPNTVYWARAYRTDEQGALEYAPDFGIRGAGTYSCNDIAIPATGILGTPESPRPIVVFKAGHVVLYDMAGVRPQAEYWVGPGATSLVSFSVSINNIATHAALTRWGFSAEGRTLMLHVEPNIHFEAIIMYGAGAVTPTAILINASYQYPNGYGFKVGDGKTLTLTQTPLPIANDLVWLSSSRSDILNKYGMTTGGEGYLFESNAALQEARTALANYLYDSARNSAIYSWGLQLRAYTKIKEGTIDATNTVVLSYLLLIPFSFLMERFIFGYSEWQRRLLAILGVFGVMLTLLLLFHPGFSLASNAYVSLLGCTVLVLTLPLLAMLGSRFLDTLASIRVERLGKHFIEIARLSATATAFESGIRSMKKHQLQAIITIVSLVLISASLVALTSLRVAPFVYRLEERGNPYYKGVCFRNVGWSPLSREFIEYLKSHFLEATVIPRSYAYISSWQLGTMVNGPKGKSSFAIIVGFTDQDPIWKEGALLRGRVFTEDELYATILVEDVANLLGVDVGDSIKFEGMDLKVVGIASSQVLGPLMEPDRYPIFPKDQRFETLQFYSPLDTLIVPYQLALYMGGTPGSAIIMPNEAEKGISIASELADWTAMELYIATEVGLNVPVYRMATARAYEATGFLTMIIPLVIAMFIVLNMMLGIVMARRNEMTILSSVGLAPIHVVGMFFAESLTYGFAGSIIGYTVGVVLTKLTVGVVKEISVNYASNFVILTIGVTIGAVTLSSIYPLIKVSKLVTPSLVRKWALPTKPIGDSWEIPLPFLFHNEDEVKGFLIFLKDWFDQHEIEDVDAKFTAREMKIIEGKYKEQLAKKLDGILHLAPFPAGIHVYIEVYILKDLETDRWSSMIHETRRSGEYSAWTLSTRIFIDEVRKQFLIWRSLSPEEKYNYSIRWGKS